ncbi:MAG: Tetratricopeptide repeat protein 39C [Thelocarpon impressellum]|nr:MAG: Tetratricopeptide repeat protein 39C [Thelocarpon impressellum]
MNDDVDAAEAGLEKGNSAFHKHLNDWRTPKQPLRTISDVRKNPRMQAQLMSAVVGVLNESLTESIKGFYKLRKAFITLDGLLEAENKVLSSRHTDDVSGKGRISVEAPDHVPGAFDDPSSGVSAEKEATVTSLSAAGDTTDGTEDEGDAFFDARETLEPGLEFEAPLTEMNDLSLGEDPRANPGVSARPDQTHQTAADQDPDSDLFVNPVDIFIHSGANLCFGLLLVMISMIPPAFSKLLFIIGFKGDRERGINLLWQASRFHNINGAMAGLTLLGYYNGLVGFCDILPDDEGEHVQGYPKQRCQELLNEMRSRYPDSRLWMLEDARMHAANRNLEVAVDILSGDVKSQLRQVEALMSFEKSLMSTYLHRYDEATENFLECMGLNSWSHALYYYIAGSAQVEQYRRHRSADPDRARVHAKRAEQYLRQVPEHSGKKKFMAKQLPFEVFVNRKIVKWQRRSEIWGVDFVDGVGVSPIEEMIYFWNGFKRMQRPHLQHSLDALAWSQSSSNPNWRDDGLDERAIHALLAAVTLRHLGKYADARDVLQTQILSHERQLFRGPLKDEWTCPAAHYEMAVLCWTERRGSGREAELVQECGAWLEKAAKWESYEMDARIGLKITSAQNTLRRYNERVPTP